MKHSKTMLAGLMLALGLQAHVVLAQEETTVFLENFDSAVPPTLPAGWLDPAFEWSTSSSVASSGSGLNNLTVSGAQASSVQTPVLDLSAMTGGTFSYLARRTSTYAQDSLIVRASIDGGATFSEVMLDKGTALPLTDGSYEAISMPVPAAVLGESQVVLMFTALGGSTSGSNIRIDDVQITGDGGVAVTPSVLGFATDVGVLDPATGTFDVDLVLDFNHADSLQGIQFDIGWDVTDVNLVDVERGVAIASVDDWDVDFEAGNAGMKAVLLGDRYAALPSGLYSVLLTLHFSLDPASTANEVVITLNSGIGALAVRSGDDAGLTLGTSTHTVSLAAGAPVFSPDAVNLDAGSVAVETTSFASLTVSNTGSADLVISDVVSDNPLYTIDPLFATLAPGASAAFTVTFAPTFTVFGYQEATLTFVHNAAGGSDVVAVSGTGLGGRGDMSEDGLVDALDLVLGIDYVLEREAPSPGQLASADVFPFEAPDGSIDVRDLTVLVRAIVLGVWPDDVAIPAAPPGAGKSDGAMEEVALELSEEDGAMKVALNLTIPVRAVQIALDVADQEVRPTLRTSSLAAAGVRVESHYDAESGAYRMVAVRMDGGFIEPGLYDLLSIESEKESITLHRGVAIDVARNRLPIGSRLIDSTAGEEEEVVRTEFRLGAPYPNPFSTREAEKLTIPLTSEAGKSITFEVFDILGRQIYHRDELRLGAGQQPLAWNAKDGQGLAIAPGLYLIRVSTEGFMDTRLVVVE